MIKKLNLLIAVLVFGFGLWFGASSVFGCGGCTYGDDVDCCWTHQRNGGCSWECSGQGGGSDRYEALGPMFKFVAYPTVESVTSWPVTSKVAAASWVEEAYSGRCAGALTQSNISLNMRALRHGSGNEESYSWAEIDPHFPSCNNNYASGQSLVRATVGREKKGKQPTWYAKTALVSLPANSPYRQFGIKILNGVDNLGNSITSNTNRPAYVEYYTWGNSRVCAWEKNGTPNNNLCFPGYPGIGSVIGVWDGTRDGWQRPRTYKINGFASWWPDVHRGSDGWDRECGFTQGSCPAGYVGIQAVNPTLFTECGLKPRLYTCKKIINNPAQLITMSSNWKPEAGSSFLTATGPWYQNNQRYKLIQQFDFTVDKSGYYYFVKCTNCSALMTVNGSLDGWNNRYYRAGQTYRGRFACWSGECDYGLGIGPKTSLADETGSNVSRSYFVPLIYKVSPLPTVDIKANGSDGPITIDYNATARLEWTSTNATSGCTASGGSWSGSKGTSGSFRTGNLTSSETYTLTCTGDSGTAVDAVTVNVRLPPPVANFTYAISPTNPLKVNFTDRSTGTITGRSWIFDVDRYNNECNVIPCLQTCFDTYKQSLDSCPTGWPGRFYCFVQVWTEYSNCMSNCHSAKAACYAAITSTQTNPTHTYPESGTYKVRLTVSNEDGSDQIEKNVVVIVPGTMELIKKEVYGATATCAQVKAGATPSPGTFKAKVDTTTHTINTPSTLIPDLTPANYTVTALNPTGDEGKYMDNSFIYCVDGSMSANPPNVAVTPGGTTTVYIGFVERSPVTGGIYEREDKGICSITGASLSSAPIQIACQGVAASTSPGQYQCVNTDGTIYFDPGSPVSIGYNPASIPEGYDWECFETGGLNPPNPVVVPSDGTEGIAPNAILTIIQDAWFQTQGGDIYAGDQIQSSIPATCIEEDNCFPILSLNSLDTANQPGSVSWGGEDNPQLADGTVSSANWQAQTGAYQGLRADYTFFRKHLGSQFEEEKMESGAYPGSGFWLTDPEKTGDPLTIGGDGWNIPNDHQVVIVHKGDIKIQTDINITGTTNASLLMIASGTITFTGQVTSAMGVYIADNIIVQDDGDTNQQFIGQGSFIGWESISLNRNLDFENNLQPGELFIYKPEFIYYLPDKVKRPLYDWHEVGY